MSWPGPGTSRIYGDIMRLISTKHDVEMINGVREFHVKFNGPGDTVYEGGVWKIRVEIPENYPFKSPSVGFINRIYHPNIDEASGSVCLDVLNQMWSPLYDMVHVFDVFLPQLLSYPNPHDPLNHDASQLYIHNREEFNKTVKEFIKQHASPEAYTRTKETSNNNGECAASTEIRETSEEESDDISECDAGELLDFDPDLFDFEGDPDISCQAVDVTINGESNELLDSSGKEGTNFSSSNLSNGEESNPQIKGHHN